MEGIERLQHAITTSSAHRSRLREAAAKGETVVALREIAGLEGLTLDLADLQAVAAAIEPAGAELSLEALSGVHGGHGGIRKDRPPRQGDERRVLPDEYPS